MDHNASILITHISTEHYRHGWANDIKHLLLSLTVNGDDDDDVTAVAMTMTVNTPLLGTVMKHNLHGNVLLQKSLT